jgi:hypothetical protein
MISVLLATGLRIYMYVCIYSLNELVCNIRSYYLLWVFFYLDGLCSSSEVLEFEINVVVCSIVRMSIYVDPPI